MQRPPVTTISWRREKDRDTKEPTGQWILFGPAHLLQPGQVTVVKRDGTVQQVLVARVSKPFDVDGVPCCYGWPAGSGAEADVALAAMRGEAAAPAPQSAPEADGWAF